MSSRSLNKVQLIGNLTRDPELRYTPQGTPVCTFGLATNRSWVPTGGERQEETEFHRIVAWQKLAELCSQLLFKGRKVYVEGRLQTRRWTDPNNQERITTEIVIDDMIILDNKRRGGEGEEEVSEAVPPAEASAKTTAAPESKKEGVAAEASASPDKEAKKKQNKEETEKKPADNEELSEADLNDIPF